MLLISSIVLALSFLAHLPVLALPLAQNGGLILVRRTETPGPTRPLPVPPTSSATSAGSKDPPQEQSEAPKPARRLPAPPAPPPGEGAFSGKKSNLKRNKAFMASPAKSNSNPTNPSDRGPPATHEPAGPSSNDGQQPPGRGAGPSRKPRPLPAVPLAR